MKNLHVYEVILKSRFGPLARTMLANAIAETFPERYQVLTQLAVENPAILGVSRTDGHLITRDDVERLYWFCLGVATTRGIPTNHVTLDNVREAF